MEGFARRLVIWFITLAVFVGAFNLISWLLGDSYSFGFKNGIVIPVVSYMLASFMLFIFGKTGKKK
ncbi:MAG: hypothetical protein IKP95_13425 [Ruminococcus sp.]|nr:hypothetical protein [Ruminococcus sp.]MBR6103422.1 hypothetical protein [Ruminococcus sp.]